MIRTHPSVTGRIRTAVIGTSWWADGLAAQKVIDAVARSAASGQGEAV